MRLRAILRLLAALSVLSLLAPLLAASCGEDDEPTTAGDMADHDHGMVDIAADGAPEVGVEVFADPAGGVNIHVRTENCTIVPRSASTEHVEGEGHFHLYVDGEKVLRFYNEWIHYAGVTEGDVDVVVELSANDHRAYAVDDPKSGWNAFVNLDAMTLSPEHASGEHVDGEGHLHIYANGQKLGRLYGPATHIAALPEGEVAISVVAYTNDHQPYVVGGQPIAAVATVMVVP